LFVIALVWNNMLWNAKEPKISKLPRAWKYNVFSCSVLPCLNIQLSNPLWALKEEKHYTRHKSHIQPSVIQRPQSMFLWVLILRIYHLPCHKPAPTQLFEKQKLTILSLSLSLTHTHTHTLTPSLSQTHTQPTLSQSIWSWVGQHMF